MADAQFAHARLEASDEVFRNAFLDQESRTSATDLALVEPDRIGQPFDGAVDIGILEDEVGRLAAEPQREGLASARRLLADDAADVGRAGEGDLVDVLVLDKLGAGLTVAGDDVEDT